MNTAIRTLRSALRTFSALALSSCVFTASAQWTWTLIAPLPMPTSNHAFCAAQVNGAYHAYTFGGITTGLANENIHRHAFRYDVATNAWAALPDVPDSLGKIASAASVVGDTAYVIGGYYVLDGSPFEISSNKVHRLNLTTNMWMSDGAPLPVPIDDHVQAVWRDSLIYVITGWSNTTNVPNVQVYDPANNVWSVGTPVPNSNVFKAFGACGVIIGDTIYYHGGARLGSNFPAVPDTRVGVIDPQNPLQITWLATWADPSLPLYRGGAFALDHQPYFVGGSAVSYNFDAVAYNGSGVVAPLARIIHYDPVSSLWTEENDQPVAVMDLRGIGALDNGEFIVAGGIGAQQSVLDSAWIFHYAPIGIPEGSEVHLLGFPNPASDRFTVHVPANIGTGKYTLFNALGQALETRTYQGPELVLDTRALAAGSYVLKLFGATAVAPLRFWSTNRVR
jgi:Galactose oxidase, central domain/Kelch motif